MNSSERSLLDRVADTEQMLDRPHLIALARLHHKQPLAMDFRVKVGQRFRPSGIPRPLPKYVKRFLNMCIDESRRYPLVTTSVDTIPAAEAHLYVNRLVALAREIGMTVRENRYLFQSYGLNGFNELQPFELAEQDGVTRAYVSKLRARFERKLRVAAAVTELASG